MISLFLESYTFFTYDGLDNCMLDLFYVDYRDISCVLLLVVRFLVLLVMMIKRIMILRVVYIVSVVTYIDSGNDITLEL